jgi:hypothetical protein
MMGICNGIWDIGEIHLDPRFCEELEGNHNLLRESALTFQLDEVLFFIVFPIHKMDITNTSPIRRKPQDLKGFCNLDNERTRDIPIPLEGVENLVNPLARLLVNPFHYITSKNQYNPKELGKGITNPSSASRRF